MKNRKYPDILHTSEIPFYPLSYQQERILYLSQLMPGSTLWNRISCKRLKGNLDTKVLEKAFDALIERHEVLKAKISIVNNKPVQSFTGSSENTLRCIYLSAGNAQQNNREVMELLNKEYQTPINVNGGALFSALLIISGENEYVLILKLHHIISDASTFRILWQDLKKLYNAYENNKGALPELPLQYKEYAVWQRETLDDAFTREQMKYWLNEFKGELPVLNMPTDFLAPSQISFKGAMEKTELHEELIRKLEILSLKKGTVLFSTLLSAFYILLNRYSSQDDISVGTLFSGRHYSNSLKNMAGFFINTVAIRMDVDADLSFIDFLQRVHKKVDEAYQMQDYPFDKLVQTVNPERKAGRNPLYSALFNVVKNYKESVGFTGIEEEVQLRHEVNSAQTDIFMDIRNNPDNLEVRLEYNTDIFRKETVTRMLAHYRNLLCSIASNPEVKVKDIEIMDADEQKQLIFWNDTKADYPRYKCVYTLFEEKALSYPEATAMVYDTASLTYRELDEKSSRLAVYLQSIGVETGTLVGIFVGRSLDIAVGLIGILKAGGAYVPLDPDYPTERIKFIIQDSKMKLIITQPELSGKISQMADEDIKIVLLDAEFDSKNTAKEYIQSAKTESPAYVLYTSGSTGKPKGVIIQHQALTNFLLAMSDKPGCSSQDRILAVTTFSFDIAGLELYLPLINGAQCHICSSEEMRDAEKLKQKIRRIRPTIMQATPATWMMLFYVGWKNEERVKILCGGEALLEKLKKSFMETGCDVWNMYGPTETTIWSSVKHISEKEPITVGNPIANTRFYILDRNLKPVSVGIPGELFIAGDGLAQGYLNRAELTAEKFINNPIEPETRLYRTGDLARWTADGDIDILGRIDHQVKIRGFRIELGEIEETLCLHPDVKEAAAVLREDNPDNKVLAAYIVLKNGGEIPEDELNRHIGKWLPYYMIPSVYVKLDKIPLTPNGKVDKSALPVPVQDSKSKLTYIAPSTEIEIKLAKIAEKLLHIERIGLNDNFFRLGGNSILTIQFIAELEDAFGVSMTIADFIDLPDMSQIAQKIKDLLSIRMTEEDKQQSEAKYWEKQLKGMPLNLKLPESCLCAEAKNYKYDIEDFAIETDFILKLKDLSRKAYTKLSMTLLAALALLISDESNQRDIVIGYRAQKRNENNDSDALTNILPIRIDLSGNPAVAQLLGDIRKVVLEAYSHQDISLSMLMDAAISQSSSESAKSPIFRVFFDLRNAGEEMPVLSELDAGSNSIMPDIALLIEENEQSLIGKWKYNADLLGADTIRRMTEKYEELLKWMAESYDKRISEFEQAQRV